MGEAYDRAGHMLGSVEADSVKEAFDKIRERIPQAAEYRIKDLRQRVEENRPAGEAGQAEQPRDRMLQFFTHGHLPDHLAKVSLPFCQLAEEICATLPSNPERTVALRKLLEAKDCAVRALLYKG